MDNAVLVYRLFDVAEEIDLNRVEEVFAQEKVTRLRLSKVKPKSMQFRNPPVTMYLEGDRLTIGGRTYPTSVYARAYDFGVISIVLRLPLPADLSYNELLNLAVELSEEDLLDPLFAGYADMICRILEPALIKPGRSEFEEDFIIYFFRHWSADWDPVPLLLAEKEPVSEQVRRETLANSFSYTPEDLTIITWDSALVYDSEGTPDIPDLLEFANAQLLELRYYDHLLSNELENMYDSIAELQRQPFRRLAKYRRILRRITETVLDITEITERIQNSLKVTEDIFYARVYSAALHVLRTRTWMESIQNKINLIQRHYTFLNDQLTNQRNMQLEFIIVVLILIEVIMGFLPWSH